jgi:hypothetical protein
MPIYFDISPEILIQYVMINGKLDTGNTSLKLIYQLNSIKYIRRSLMPPKNPLKEDKYPQEPVKGENIINLNKQKIVRINLPDGQTLTSVNSETGLKKDPNGQYTDAEITNVVIDPFGNPMIIDPANFSISHTGQFITSPQMKAVCTSIFHRNPNKNILIGQDGRLLANGEGICNHCQNILYFIYVVLGIFGIGTIIGLYKALNILN